ncbi:MAG: hypothetical protein Q8P50_13305 [Bacillota bacterium]|nr:hypothetical protein [Bacillota bacterium]
MASENYCEYRDEVFLTKLRVEHLIPDLRTFWPRGGPVWDGLGVVAGSTGQDGVLLVEAKSHLSEVAGSWCACRAGKTSRRRFEERFSHVKRALGVKQEAEWLTDYYQSANRLAHLEFFLTHGVPAWLVHVYFVGDSCCWEDAPDDAGQWSASLVAVKNGLGLLDDHPREQQTIYVFPPAVPS